MSRSVSRTALPLVLTATMAGCASEERPPARPFVAVERPSEPQPCPMPFGNDDGQQFDARSLLGLREGEARSEAARADCEIRVVRRDGLGLAVTGDLRPNRIDVEVRDGFVVVLADQGWTSYAPLSRDEPPAVAPTGCVPAVTRTSAATSGSRTTFKSAAATC